MKINILTNVVVIFFSFLCYLLQDSVFCLILPGPRLMDIVFIDALAAGCIPIVAINHVVLPFFEVIDWKRFEFSVVLILFKKKTKVVIFI